MFDAILADARSWKNSVEAIAALIDEGTLHIDENGFKLRAMDPSQIALVDFELPAKAFEKYELEKSVDITIDFSELLKITKRIKTEDKIEFKLDKRLNIILRGASTRKFEISIIESSFSLPKEPNIEFTSEVQLGAGLLKDALKDAELVSNRVVFQVKDDTFIISSEGDTGSVSIEIPREQLLSISSEEETRAMFSLDQLNNLIKAADSDTIVTLKLRTDMPLKLEYALGEGRVLYYLAPRIE
ncbi:MAG TPA: proliferating cell nuclear antigen (pcna) [Candidatus Altiarchaeales archaeon]|nr:MAG: proliferating cell nuclear antigen (pcna) [Candidatus Altiarchaeales archaeon]HDN83783.1 proliferating cell nuclear antigen (pcna) [Candidatus Altiarchaeales archaeon]